MRTPFDVRPDIKKLLDPPTCEVCGDPYATHEHYRSGTDCAQCSCPQYRATTSYTQYAI